MTPLTDQELKLRLADLLDEHIVRPVNKPGQMFWKYTKYHMGPEVKDTELLELCHRIEGKMTRVQKSYYLMSFQHDDWSLINATWQNRARAIIETLGQQNDK